MGDIQWDLLNRGGGQNALAQGLQIGQQLRQSQDARAQRHTLSQLAADPNADDAQFEQLLRPLIETNPQLAVQMRQSRQKERMGTQDAHRQQIVTMGKLLNHATDETTFQQSRAAAQQLGMDVSKIPPNYDPNWVAQQKMIVGAFEKDSGDGISGIARELKDAGYQPGTPEFNDAMRGVIQNKYAADYVDEQGNTRRRSALNLGGSPAHGAAPQAGHVEDGYRFKGGNPADPNAWEKLGGPTSHASATFRSGFRGLPGETVTSTFRTPEHNKAVGGVGNSYHMRRGPDGQPLARDSVPPHGMTMRQYYAQLQALNPDKDVIFEGDHVHMEPR